MNIHFSINSDAQRFILIKYRVVWGNSDQNVQNFFYFCSFSVSLHYGEVIFGWRLEPTLLYRLVKESPKNIGTEKSIGTNNEMLSEVIRITPHGVIRINTLN